MYKPPYTIKVFGLVTKVVEQAGMLFESDDYLQKVSCLIENITALGNASEFLISVTSLYKDVDEARVII